MTPYLFVGLPLHIQRFYSKKTEIASMRVREIIKIVESEIEISFEESDTTCRKRELADARHAFCYYIRNYSVLSLKKIGRLYKQNRDHTTIINSIKKWENLVSTDRDTRITDAIIRGKIESHS